MARPDSDTATLEELRNLIEEEQALYDMGILDEHAQLRLQMLRMQLDRTWTFLHRRRAYLACSDPQRPSELFGETYYR